MPRRPADTDTVVEFDTTQVSDLDIARAMATPVQVVGDDQSEVPWLGQRVHFLGQGASQCMIGIVINIPAPTPGLPDNRRVDLAVFNPVTPHPIYVTAEHDDGRGYSTWHRIHP